LGQVGFNTLLATAGAKIARKGGEGKGLSVPRFFPCAEREPGDMPLAMTREEIV